MPFWLGGFAAALGIFLRRAMHDPPVFVARKAEVRARTRQPHCLLQQRRRAFPSCTAQGAQIVGDPAFHPCRAPPLTRGSRPQVRAKLELEELEAGKLQLTRRPSSLAAASQVIGRLASSFLHPRTSGAGPVASAMETAGSGSCCCSHLHKPSYSPVLGVLRSHLGSVAIQFCYTIW